MNRRVASFALVAAWVGSTVARGTDYAGTFRGDIKGQPSSVALAREADGYSGTIRLGGSAFPCRATEQGGQLTGTFQSGTTSFPFTAALAGDTLTLSTAGTAYTLNRPAANPLDGAASTPPPALASEVDATVLARTDTGRAVFFHWPQARSAADALHATAPLLPKLVGGPAKLTGAFADAKTKTRGGASFTGTNADGKPIRGMIFCGGDGASTGEATSVLYATTDAPDADWAKLRAGLPKEAVKLRTYQFPDGTGSVDLPEGWSTTAQSLDFGFFAQGPDGQGVGYGQAITVQGPNSQLVQLVRQNEQMARQMGMRPVPRPPMIVGELAPPAEAIPALFPQVDAVTRQSLGYGLRFDRMLVAKDVQPSLPNGRAQQMTYTFFKIRNAGEQHLRSVAQAETAPLFGGAWLYCSTELSAPDDQFDAVAPTLDAIVKSVKPNQEVMLQHQQQRAAQMQQQGQDNLRRQREQFDRQQQAHRDQQAAFDRYNQGWHDRQVATSRSNDDFCEVIRGYRTVYDTTTGQSHSVELNYAQGVAEALNKESGDPNRFVPIPLRDELDPLH